MEEQRQVDRGHEARADRQRPAPAHRQAALDCDVGGQAPGEHRHQRTDDHRRHLGRGEGRAERPPSGWRPATTAAAARPRRPAAGRPAAASGSSRSRRRRGRGPRPGCARRRSSTRRPAGPGTGSATRTRRGRRARSRRSRAADRIASRRVIERCVDGVDRQAVDAGVRTARPIQAGRSPAITGAAAGTVSSLSRTSQRMS